MKTTAQRPHRISRHLLLLLLLAIGSTALC